MLESGAAPQSEKEQEEAEELDELPEVCICLADSTSTECKTAAQTFALANPEHIPVFTQASSGDEAAKKVLEDRLMLLVNFVSCKFGLHAFQVSCST